MIEVFEDVFVDGAENVFEDVFLGDVADPSTPDVNEVWTAQRRRRDWRVYAMAVGTHAARNQLDGFTFGDGTYYADLTNLLGNRTLASAALVSQSQVDPDTGDVTEEEALTVGTPTVLASATTIYDGPSSIGTIAIGKGFSVTIEGGGPALYTLQFSFEDSAGNVDGVEVQFNVR